MTAGAAHLIAHMTWDQVAARIAGGALAIVPVGAGGKEHGLHLPMNSDQIQAEWLAAGIAARMDALIWPTLTYGYYPAFVDYAGSVSLREKTFTTIVQEIVEGIVGFGCRHVVVLDTGISTIAPIDRALAHLDGVALHLKIHDGPRYRRAVGDLSEQTYGSHADEIETSIMLALALDRVDMSRAEASPPRTQDSPGRLASSDPTSANYSRSGSYGDPTLATPAKGDILVSAMIDDLLDAVMDFRQASDADAAQLRAVPQTGSARR